MIELMVTMEALMGTQLTISSDGETLFIETKEEDKKPRIARLTVNQVKVLRSILDTFIND